MRLEVWGHPPRRGLSLPAGIVQGSLPQSSALRARVPRLRRLSLQLLCAGSTRTHGEEFGAGLSELRRSGLSDHAAEILAAFGRV